jgi:hypothetical protein
LVNTSASSQALAQHRRREVADADVPHQPAVLQVAHGAERLLERHVAAGPVHQQQVDVLDAERAEARLGAACARRRPVVARPHLGRQEDVVARHARAPEPCADLRLVEVALRGVEVAVAERQRALDRLDARLTAQLPGPEAEDRDAAAVVVDALHGDSLSDAASPGSRTPAVRRRWWCDGARDRARRDRRFLGWDTVVGGAGLQLLQSALFFQSFGIYVVVWVEELGWSRGAIAAGTRW